MTKHKGKLLGVPYDFRRPTKARIKSRIWNPKDKHIMTPKVFGWGWTINLYQVFRKVKIVERK